MRLDAANNANTKLIIHRFQKPIFEKIILLLEIIIGGIDEIFHLIFVVEKLRGNCVTPSDMLFQAVSFDGWFEYAFDFALHKFAQILFAYIWDVKMRILYIQLDVTTLAIKMKFVITAYRKLFSSILYSR